MRVYWADTRRLHELAAADPVASVAVISRAAAWLSPTHPVAAAKPPAGQPNTNPTARTAPLNRNRRKCAISQTIHRAMTVNHGPSKAADSRVVSQFKL